MRPAVATCRPSRYRGIFLAQNLLPCLLSQRVHRSLLSHSPTGHSIPRLRARAYRLMLPTL